MKKRKIKSNTNTYSKIFSEKPYERNAEGAENKLLGFTVFYDTKYNKMVRMSCWIR